MTRTNTVLPPSQSQPGMSLTPETAPVRRASLADALTVYLKARVMIVMLLGFSAGLPLALSGSTLLVWMRPAAN